MWRTNRTYDPSDCSNEFSSPAVSHFPCTQCSAASFYQCSQSTPSTPTNQTCGTPSGWLATRPTTCGSAQLWVTGRTQDDCDVVWSAPSVECFLCVDDTFYNTVDEQPSTPSSTLECSTPPGWSETDPGQQTMTVWDTDRSQNSAPSCLNTYTTPSVAHFPCTQCGSDRFWICAASQPSAPTTQNCGTPSGWSSTRPATCGSATRWYSDRSQSDCDFSWSTPAEDSDVCAAECASANFWLVASVAPSTPDESLSCNTPSGWLTTDPGQQTQTVWVTTRSQSSAPECLNTFTSPSPAYLPCTQCTDAFFYRCAQSTPSTPTEQSCSTPSGWSSSLISCDPISGEDLYRTQRSQQQCTVLWTTPVLD